MASSSSSFGGAPSTDRILRCVAWALLVISSTVVFGRASEQCELVPYLCPSRFAWVISCGVISALIAMTVLILSCCRLDWLPYAEAMTAVFLTVWWAAGAGVAANFRTVNISPLIVAFVSSFCMLFSLISKKHNIVLV